MLPPPWPFLQPPPVPRWFGAIRWKRLALRQMEAPTVQLLKEVGTGCEGGRHWGGPGAWR